MLLVLIRNEKSSMPKATFFCYKQFYQTIEVRTAGVLISENNFIEKNKRCQGVMSFVVTSKGTNTYLKN
jgi:hypothetical protein